MAARYDYSTRRINSVRRRAIAALALAPGETVLDVGCGTGFCFAPLMAAVGPSGCILSFDHSTALLSIARSRVADAGWGNVAILESRAEAVDFRAEIARRGIAPPSALLFSYVHDVMQSDAALDIFTQSYTRCPSPLSPSDLFQPPATCPFPAALSASAWCLALPASP